MNAIRFLPLLCLLLLALPAAAQRVERDVAYELPDGRQALGLLVYDNAFTSASDTSAGVLIVPEWWGLTEFPIDQARRLADQGRVVFVADMYGDRRTTDDAGEAGKLSGAAKVTGLAALAAAALEAFAGTGAVDPGNVAAIGFCFGGSTVADLVKRRAGIVGAVSFHGGLSGDAAPDAADGGGDYAPLALFHGGADPLVKPADFGAFVERSIAAGVPLAVVSYPGVKHAFTNPAADSYGMEATAYDEAAAESAFALSEIFLDLVLGE